MENQKKKSREKFNLKHFFVSKILLLAALVCEILAYLMHRQILCGTPRVISGLTVAGAVIVLIYLVKSGLSGKIKHYSEKWGIGPYADNSGSKKSDGE